MSLHTSVALSESVGTLLRRVTTYSFEVKKKRDGRQRCTQRHRASVACVKCFAIGSFGNRLGNHIARNPRAHVLQSGYRMQAVFKHKQTFLIARSDRKIGWAEAGQGR